MSLGEEDTELETRRKGGQQKSKLFPVLLGSPIKQVKSPPGLFHLDAVFFRTVIESLSASITSLIGK